MAGFLRSTLVAVALSAAAWPAAAKDAVNALWERIETRAGDGRRTIEAQVLEEAADGGLLVEFRDTRYAVLEPAAVLGREPAAPPAPESPREFARRVLADLPAGFAVHVTKHYVICYDTSRDYAAWCGGVFERLHEAFGNYWRHAGIAVEPAPNPLVVVIFGDRRKYEAYAANDLGAAADRVVGYYNLLSNRVTTFDLTGSDAVSRTGGRGAGTAILASPEAAGLVSTLVHEATHQMAFNGGLHRRLAPVPLWVSEGVATFFETPDLENARGWRGVGEVNRPRLERFLQTHRAGSLAGIVTDDDAFRRADSAIDAYAAAWALTAFLARTRRDDFVRYLQALAAKRPFAEDSPAIRIREFEAAFGASPAELEEPLVRHAGRLQSRTR